MSMSVWMIEPVLAELDGIKSRFSASVEEVEKTNKRTVYWCADKAVACNLVVNLRNKKYEVDLRKGLKSSAWYVQVYY